MNAPGSPENDHLVLGLVNVRKDRMAGSKRRRRHSRDDNRRRFKEAADLYLADCYARQKAVSVKEFAATHVDATRPYLSRMAPRVVGTTIGDYFRSRQLEHAKELLRALPPDVTILDIALSSGFGSPWTFTRAFRKAFGVTPGKYRREAAERERRRR